MVRIVYTERLGKYICSYEVDGVNYFKGFGDSEEESYQNMIKLAEWVCKEYGTMVE